MGIHREQHKDSGKLTFISEYGPDIVIGIFIILASSKILQDLDLIFDLPLGDESFYLYNGVNLFELGFPSGEWSPFYAAWYWIIAQLELTKDNLNLYFYNQRILICSTAIMLYFALRSLGTNRIISISLSWMYLLSAIPVILPRPSHLVLLLLLILIAFQNKLKDEIDFCLLFGIFLLISSFIRPEFFLSYLITSGYIIFLIIKVIISRNRKILKGVSLKSASYILSSSILITKFGIPTNSGDRGWQAFSQHFALRWSWNHSTDLNPWLDSQKIIETVFGNAESLRQALTTNPIAFLNHIFKNIQGCLQNTIDIFNGSLLDQSPSLGDVNTTIDSIVRSGEFILIIIALGLVFRGFWLRPNAISRPMIKRLFFINIIAGIAVFPATIIIFPRYHYLIIPIVLIGVFFGYLCSSFINHSSKELSSMTICLIGLILLLLTPILSKGWCPVGDFCFARLPHEPIRPNIATIQYMRHIGIDGMTINDHKVNILAAELEYRPYVDLGHSFNMIDMNNNTNIQRFLLSNNIDLIVFSPALQNDWRLLTNESWEYFLNHYTQLDFQKVQIPNTDRALFISDQLSQSL